MPESLVRTLNPGFDTQALYNATLNAKNALIDSAYNSTLNNMTNAYNTDKMESELQRGEIGRNYDDAKSEIRDQTYRGIEQSKVSAVQRGITNSAQGQALNQGLVRSGNDSINSATRDRDTMLNDLTSRINNLTSKFGADKTNLAANKGIKEYGAQNEAMSAKLGADLDIYKLNSQQDFTAGENALQRDFTSGENVLNREQQTLIANLGYDMQWKVAQLSANTQRAVASLASIDRQAAIALAEEHYQTSRNDRTTDLEMQYIAGDTDMSAKNKFIYFFDLFGKDRKTAEKSYNNQVTLLTKGGTSKPEAEEMVSSRMNTNGSNTAEAIQNYIESLINK